MRVYGEERVHRREWRETCFSDLARPLTFGSAIVPPGVGT